MPDPRKVFMPIQGSEIIEARLVTITMVPPTSDHPRTAAEQLIKRALTAFIKLSTYVISGDNESPSAHIKWVAKQGEKGIEMIPVVVITYMNGVRPLGGEYAIGLNICLSAAASAHALVKYLEKSYDGRVLHADVKVSVTNYEAYDTGVYDIILERAGEIEKAVWEQEHPPKPK